MVMNLLRKVHKHQGGISRISVAGITIAALAVAGLLAYSSLSSDDSSVTVYGTDNSNALELRGTVFVKCNPTNTNVNEVMFTVAIPGDAVPLNFTSPPNNVVEISYVDEDGEITNIPWKSKEYVYGDGDDMLEIGETFHITALLGESLDSGPSADTTFTIKITTPDGENVTIKRTTPEVLAPVMNLQ